MKTRISAFAAVVVILGTLGFSTATRAQYDRGGEGRGGNYSQDGGQDGDRNNRGKNFVALTNNNRLVKGNYSRRISSVKVTGTNENLLGIDYRPANGMLYGITSTKIYMINADTGAATEVSTLSQSIAVGQESGVDFNPVVDRLRVVGSNDQNFRINVDTGAVITDGNIDYAAGDRNAGQNPSLTAAAYTNSFAGAPAPTRTTVLYDIDYDRDVLTIQNPPNNGTLQTVGSLKANFDQTAGFNISGENNNALAVSDSTLYEIDLIEGRARKVAKLPKAQYIGLAVPLENRSK